jgi:hypothetical protein
LSPTKLGQERGEVLVEGVVKEEWEVHVYFYAVDHTKKLASTLSLVYKIRQLSSWLVKCYSEVPDGFLELQ